MIPSRRAWAVMSITEKAHELQIVMGALGIELFPAPLPRVIQEKLRDALPSALPLIEARRQELAALPPQKFEKVFIEALNPFRISEGLDLSAFGPKGTTAFAYGAALTDRREPVAAYLRHFEGEGFKGQEAVFMARFFNQILEHMDEPARSEMERSVIGAGSKSERHRRWFKFMHDELRAQGKA